MRKRIKSYLDAEPDDFVMLQVLVPAAARKRVIEMCEELRDKVKRKKRKEATL